MRRHFTVTGFVSHDGRTALHWHKFGIWLPPGGHIEADEDPVQAMLREVREETGLEVVTVPASPAFAYTHPPQLVAPVTVAVYDIANGDGQLAEAHQHIDFIYFTRLAGPADDPARRTPPPALPDDGMQWRWFSEDDVRSADNLNDDVRELSLAAIQAVQSTPSTPTASPGR